MRAGEMGLTVESAELPNDICGLYDDRHGLILLADWLNQRQRRCRRETALTLISPVDYGMAEEVYEGNTWMMAVELSVTIQVLSDYRQLLYDSGVCMQ